jgi:tetratricopeptide (TPR) repeat protein
MINIPRSSLWMASMVIFSFAQASQGTYMATYGGDEGGLRRRHGATNIVEALHGLHISEPKDIRDPFLEEGSSSSESDLASSPSSTCSDISQEDGSWDFEDIPSKKPYPSFLYPLESEIPYTPKDLQSFLRYLHIHNTWEDISNSSGFPKEIFPRTINKSNLLWKDCQHIWEKLKEIYPKDYEIFNPMRDKLPSKPYIPPGYLEQAPIELKGMHYYFQGWVYFHYKKDILKIFYPIDFHKADLLFERDAYKRAFDFFEKAIACGEKEAYYWLGEMYAKGMVEGMVDRKINYEQARRYFLNAANHGSFNAFKALGLMCAQGKGVARDIDQAIHYFEQALAHRRTSIQEKEALKYLEELKSPVAETS